MNKINKFEKKIHSQNGEDGILEFIFSLIGTTNKSFIEFGFATRNECNTAYLAIKKGWNGILIDANSEGIKKSKKFFKKNMGKNFNKIKILNYMINCENINKIFLDHRTSFQIDLLSIDIDGNDYWIWKEISSINPRVVVIEYNAHLGKEKALTVNYDPQFNVLEKHWSRCYFGASLNALEKLGKSKGYYLVGCDSKGVNAFFIRNDLKHKEIEEKTSIECWNPPMYKYSKKGLSEMLKEMTFVEV